MITNIDMDPPRRMSITGITSQPVNRLQGELAAEKLEQILREGAVRLELDAIPYAFGTVKDPPDSAFGRINPDPGAMTPAFLNGLTDYIIREGLENSVTFSSANPHVRRNITLTAAHRMSTLRIEDPGQPGE